MAINNDGWEKVGVSKAWNFETDGKEFVGIYVSMQPDVGDNHSKMYDFDVNGESRSVWGNAVLDVRLKNVRPGEEVKIVYLGMANSEKVRGRKYKNFEVYHRPAPFKKVESAGEEIDFNDLGL